MKPRIPTPRATGALAAALLAAGTLGATTPAHATGRTVHLHGTLASGATYVLDAPAHWNGTLLLFSHGYRAAGSSNPAEDASDARTARLLLAEGYALAGSSYATTGWAVAQAVPDQLATFDAFTARIGRAQRTIAWGQSYGGLVTTALAERHPDRLDGSLSTCGLVQGGVANWNSTLDPVFALKTLLAPGSRIPLTRLGSQANARAAARALTGAVTRAQRSATGRARIALAAALHNIPGWNDPAQTRPAPTDYTAQQANQYQAMTGLLAMPAFSWRREAEHRAGGSPSWNTGVNYAALLRRSADYPEVKALYKAAGRSLAHDLATLNKAPRLHADPSAVAYLTRNIAFTGRLRKPQLDIHTAGDPLIPVQSESAYRRAVSAAGTTRLLRQAYVDNAGHCTFTPAERAAALHAVDRRITTGHWGGTGPAALNTAAHRLDPTTAARYIAFRPGPYPRPFDLAHHHRTNTRRVNDN
ncbi:alpha/beta hydrolase family protein [Streptomyces sp. WZ-12]|uniref:alpha/beta hydrolase family protein n=1 Tax=Streptomyces sp. WZ-12 TaxID=3030210 RepID=UPI00406C0BD0